MIIHRYEKIDEKAKFCIAKLVKHSDHMDTFREWVPIEDVYYESYEDASEILRRKRPTFNSKYRIRVIPVKSLESYF